MADTGVSRIVPNLVTDEADLGRAFFVDLLGLRVGMDLGWIATYVSPTAPAVQVSVLRAGTEQPALSVEVADVDRVHREAVARGHRVVYPYDGRAVGRAAILGGGPRRRGRQRPVARPRAGC